jgi:hypothetical protein
MRGGLLVLALSFASGCEPKLPDGWPHDAGQAQDSGVDAGPMHYVSFDADGGMYSVVVDSMYSSRWTAIDLDTAQEVPFEADAWDLAFQRFHIRERGGVDGDGGVEVAVVYDAGYPEVTRAPAGPWLVDQPDGPDDNTDPDTVFDKLEVWYDYDPTFHSLTPRPLVYVIHSDRGAYFKLKIDGYYDNAGTPAIFSLRYAPVLAP